MIGHIIGWIVLGIVAGAIARLLVPGRQPMGLLATMALGIVGSFVGGFIASLFNGGDMIRSTNWIGSTLGAVLVLALFVILSKRRRTTL